MIRVKLFLAALTTALICACASVVPTDAVSVSGGSAALARPGINAPVIPGSGDGATPRLAWAESLSYEADGPYTIDLASVPAGVYDPNNQLDSRRGGGRIESQLSDEVTDLLRAEALLMEPQAGIEEALLGGPTNLGPVAGVSFDSLDYTDCCGGGGNVPPDPELAAGPSHIIAVVNVAFEIYDKSGTLLSGPTTFSSFFAGTPGCSNTSVFDPNVIYDEAEDRFILGIDGDGSDYCIAATTGSDPTSTWHRYAFPTDIGGRFFDYPHAGVGLDAIYMGANMFAGGFAEGRVWAIDKSALYGGFAPAVVSRSMLDDGTPQPMNLHGFMQGTWPVSGPHYILTDDNFNGATYAVWSWDDPFGSNSLTKNGTFNLNTATGYTGGFPVDAPQLKSAETLQANDWRVQDAEYRNGDIWMSNTISCNPGTGTVDCIRWAQIDPESLTVVNAGVLGSNDEFRTFADLAVNDCDDMAVGYTKTSTTMYPAVFVAGRESSDPVGTLQAEVVVKSGERSYSAFSSSPHRWGDYSGMTIDPDGQTFWYLGEYSKETGDPSGYWGNYIGSFSFPDCATPQAPGQASSPTPGDGSGNVDVEADLSWAAGSGATSHDVYFGTNPAPDVAEFQGNQGGNSYDPGTLANSTTYYWRVDEVNTEGTTTGSVWSFTTEAAPVLPGPATNPSPADAATAVAITSVLGWTAGSDTDSHDVYFGTNPAPDAAEFQGNQGGNAYDPGTLANSTTYYWRIDEVNSDGTTTGSVWSFTTEAAPVPEFHVASVVVVAEWIRNRRYKGVATITVHDEGGSTVEAVALSGTFSGDWNGTRSGATNGSGQLVVETPGVRNGNSWDFCIDSASKDGWVFETDASSNFLCDATPPPPPGGEGTIKGIVRSTSGARLKGALVQVQGGPSVTTNRRGRYTIRNVAEGTQTVTASKSGYTSETGPVTVTADSTVTRHFNLSPN